MKIQVISIGFSLLIAEVLLSYLCAEIFKWKTLHRVDAQL